MASLVVLILANAVWLDEGKYMEWDFGFKIGFSLTLAMSIAVFALAPYLGLRLRRAWLLRVGLELRNDGQRAAQSLRKVVLRLQQEKATPQCLVCQGGKLVRILRVLAD